MFDSPDRILARLKAPLLFAAAMLLLWFGFEALLYRSGIYVRLAEPESNTGAVVNALMQLERQYQPGARHVLVFGDSRIGEGFSAPVANQVQGELRFLNLAVPGSTPRTWSYLLRAIDRAGYRYEAVVVGTLYRPSERTLRADWPLDPAHHAPLLDLRDAIAYPRTYATDEMRERARHAVFFPALSLRTDTQALLASPRQRLHRLYKYRPGYLAASADYPGRDESMPALAFAADDTVLDWGTASADQRALVEAHLNELRAPIDAAVAQANREYLDTWLGAIARRADAQGARMFLLPLPRGPYRDVLDAASEALPAVEAIAAHDNATALPADLLTELEQPQFFFDTLHANRTGRERLSAILATRVRDALAVAER